MTAPAKRRALGDPSAGRVVAILAIAATVLYFAVDVLLLVFTGILLAILLYTSAQAIARRSRLTHRQGLVVTVLLLLLAAVAFWTFTVPELARQADQLRETLPRSVEQVTSWLEQYGWGRWVIDQVQSAIGPGGGGGQVAQRAARFASGILGTLVSIVVVLFVGVYLAANPEPYQAGLLRLVPARRRERAAEVVAVVAYTLRWWLLGQLVAMSAVGLLMGVGLALIGVPLALGLGVLAGLLEFVPTFGPVIALLPAILLAAQQGGTTVLWVLGLYLAVQTAESYVLTPLIQQRAVELPPVLTISAQVLLGSVFGVLGLLVAVPLTAAVVVIVKMLYVEDRLGEDVHVAGEDGRRAEVPETKPAA